MSRHPRFSGRLESAAQGVFALPARTGGSERRRDPTLLRERHAGGAQERRLPGDRRRQARGRSDAPADPEAIRRPRHPRRRAWPVPGGGALSMGVDPIDGTKAFISNCFIFGTLISLVRDGRPILGAIASPLTGHVLVGLGVEQTLLGERPVQVRSCSRIEDATV
ncbi:MAG: hypothetical protein E6H79_16200, partial [Betaproteobacteria bacterium]